MNPLEEIKRLQEKYAIQAKKQTFNFLIIGKNGTGKTQIARTCWLPVHIDSFDIGGTSHLKKEIEAGKIIVDSTWEEMASAPCEDFMTGAAKYSRILVAYMNKLRERKTSGYFERFGTYMLDSITGITETFVEAVIQQEKRKEGLYMSDYKILWRLTRNVISEVVGLPCDVVVTGHLQIDVDEVTGRQEVFLLFPGKFKFAIGGLFNEIYVAFSRELTEEEKKTSKEQTKHVLLTRGTEKHTATTKLGSGCFDMYEVPNIMKLRDKAGRHVEHKELLK